jgi:hypothetical protein
MAKVDVLLSKQFHFMAKVDVLQRKQVEALACLLTMKHTNIQHGYLKPWLKGNMDLGFVVFCSSWSTRCCKRLPCERLVMKDVSNRLSL